MEIVSAIMVAIVAALFSSFAVYYFSTKNNTTKIYDIVEKELAQCI